MGHLQRRRRPRGRRQTTTLRCDRNSESRRQKTVGSVALVTHPDYDKHTTGPGHPERPERIRAVTTAIEVSGLQEHIAQITPEPVDVEVLEHVHQRSHIDRVRNLAVEGGGQLDPDTVVSAHSFDVARLAAGGAVAAVSSVLDGQVSAAFAAIRPPGHHARSAHGMGFCLFNNVAVAAAEARKRYSLTRIGIVDWDVHHGNGTQEIFYRDRSMLYISTHQEHWYPGTGRIEEHGEGEGEGFTINIPLPAGTGDEGYRLVFEEIVLPVLDAFTPQLLLISAGYDAHFDDPLGGMVLSRAGFRGLATFLITLADRHEARVAAVLEGGYQLAHLGQSVVATLEAFTGRTALGVENDEPRSELPYQQVATRVRAIRSAARNYWNI